MPEQSSTKTIEKTKLVFLKPAKKTSFPMNKKIYPPFFSSTISAGFPSPADDYIEQHLDLNELLIKHPTATFFVRVQGTSMINAGIKNGDILIVDRSIEATNGNIIIAVVNNEFLVKRLHKRGNAIWLLPENPKYTPLQITENIQFEVWGVVTSVIHHC